MRYFCTLSDKNYLKKGVALINSLTRVSSEEFILYYLCLDSDTYSRVSQDMTIRAKYS